MPAALKALKTIISKPTPSGGQPQQSKQSPSPSSAKDREIVIPLTIKVGKAFKEKLPLLIGLVLFFAFSMIMFDKANLKTTDLSDLARVQYNIPKIYSLSMILFVLLFALSVALGIYYSIRLGWAASLLVVPATFLPALLLSLIFYPWLLTTFLAFALVVSFCSFFASFWNELSLSRAWSVLSAGMVLFMLLAFLVVFYKVAENKDAHVNLLLDSLVAQAGQTNGFYVSGSTVASAVSKNDLAAFITQDSVRSLLLSSYPGFASLTDDQKTALIQSFHDQLVDYSYNAFTQNSGAIAQSVNANLAQVASGGSSALKQQIYALPQFKTVYDHFAFLSASIAALIAAFAGFLIQVFAIAFLFALDKVFPFNQ